MFKVGDKVIINIINEHGLVEDPLKLEWNSSMMDLHGKTATIKTVSRRGNNFIYRLDNEEWVWQDAWLKPANGKGFIKSRSNIK